MECHLVQRQSRQSDVTTSLEIYRKTNRVVGTVFSHGLSKRNCIVPVHQSASFSACFIDFL